MPRELDVVYIGKESLMSYVLAIITNLARSGAKEVTLKVRGRAITMAVDVTEITKRRFLKSLDVGKITKGTEEIQREEVEPETF